MTLSKRKVIALVLGVFVILPAGFLYTGYNMGLSYLKANPDDMAMAMQSELDAQRLQIDEATRVADENMNALALRLGQLQAHVIRMDALGQRLTKMAKLDKGEFNFDKPPAQGGPVSSDSHGNSMSVPDFIKSLNE
ncbi:MAG: hypothetical protein OEZ33_04460, partial [Gammaproteobacteria bacterium]|nr:hypothetical protein [Gammaproteobacteria bacterium]